jgi:hypothetical protein
MNEIPYEKRYAKVGLGQLEAVEYNIKEAIKFIQKLPDNESIDKRLSLEILEDQVKRLEDYRTFQEEEERERA